MSWKLIKSIQKETDLRLILPFGLTLKLGDVISVGKDGTFTLEASAGSVLQRGLLKSRSSQPANPTLYHQSGKKTTVQFRAAGSGSALFQNLSNANAGMDISFGSANEWVMAATGRALRSLEEIDVFRRPILDAYRRKVWKRDWALVTSVATAQKLTLLASRTQNTKIALSLNDPVQAKESIGLKLTAGATILATSAQITQCIVSEPIVAFCSAVRVHHRWWSRPDIRTLAAENIPKRVIKARRDDFWESIS